MRVKGINLQQLLLAAMLVAALCWNLASAAEIKRVRIETTATGTRAEVQLDRDSRYKLIDLHGPERLVVDFADSHLQRGLALPPAAGVVRAIRSGQPEPGIVRIVFDLGSKVAVLKPRIEQSGDGPRLVLEWPGDGGDVRSAPKAPAAAVPNAVDPIGAMAGGRHFSITEPVDADPVARDPISGGPVKAEPVAAGTIEADPGEADPIARIARRVTPAVTDVPHGPAVIHAPAGEAPRTKATHAESSMPGVIATGVPTRIASGIPTVPVSPDAPAATPPWPAPRRSMQGGMRPLVVAIDPGHGGQDPGSRGPGGTREKDVVLAIARELARQVNATPGLKAFLTRDADQFVPLPQRARKASAAKADIFLSIHADAWTSPTAKGAGIFVLSTRGASSQRARWLADKENAAGVIGGAHVHKGDAVLANVLLDLTQSGNLKASEEAASHILTRLDEIGDMHKNEVERANFSVLRTSDRMPAMLVETGFISNPGEEAKLRDPSYQRRLAAAILDGVDRYFSRQPPPGTLYAARAQAAMGGGGGSP